MAVHSGCLTAAGKFSIPSTPTGFRKDGQREKKKKNKNLDETHIVQREQKTNTVSQNQGWNMTCNSNRFNNKHFSFVYILVLTNT